jgi:hypothetical protein
MWMLTKEEIEQWLEKKDHEFSRDQNKNPQISSEKWLQRYVFTDLHEIFFVDFSNVLAEWLQRLDENSETFCTIIPRNWTPQLIRQVNIISNQISHAVDFWLDSVLGGYITKFVIYCTQSAWNIFEITVYLDQDVVV